MDVVIHVSDDTRSDGSALDVCVSVEPSHPVASLIAALAAYCGTVRAPGTLELVRSATGEVLDRAVALDAAGLLSGEELVLRPATARIGPVRDLTFGGARPWRAPTGPARGPAGGASLDLVVASGPDVGWRRQLMAGRCLIGRDPSCWLVVTDPAAARIHLELVVDPDPDPGPDPGPYSGTGPGPGTITILPRAEAPDDVHHNGVPVQGPLTIAPGDRIGFGATTLRIEPAPPPRPTSPGVVGEAPFHRTPYFPTPVEERVFDPMGEIPERPDPARFAYLAALAPLVMGVTMALVYSPRFLIFAAFSPLVAVAGHLDQRRRTSRVFGRGAARYRRRLDERLAAIGAAQQEERSRRFRNAPDVAELAERARLQSVELWIRDRRAVDFLSLRLGLGSVPSAVRVRAETRGDEVLRDELAAELADREMLHHVPVTVDLARVPLVGLVGAPADTGALAASLLIQAACLHSPEDLVIVAATAGHQDLTRWLRWVPHTRSASSPLEGLHLAHEPPAIGALLAELLVTAESRAADRDRSIDRRWPWILALIDRDADPDPALVSRLLDLCPEVGMSVLWLCANPDRTPRQALARVSCAPAVGGTWCRLSHTDPSLDDRAFRSERLAAPVATSIARDLAGLRDASSANASSALPRTVTLHQALGVDTVTPDWVSAQWLMDRGHTLPTPIGLAGTGPLVLDLVEHGPHGLIGGTSGAGKSELLMSLVAGLVALNPPTRVNLLFIDYKGGASSEPFRTIPHTVGCVTNLDALLARRALISLRAELNRRMTLLQGRARDLAEMLERHPAEAPPALVIVVDEFATLVKEVPEFVAGMVDIAQRGRSLGIHLLLATQRPSGAVNENILANTNLRISLRMIDGAESSSVIGSPDAAAIPTPLKGRGFARLGPGQLVAFQSAWSGAPLHQAQGPPPVRVAPFGPAPRRPPAPRHRSGREQDPGGGAGGAGPMAGSSQLEGIVAAVRETAEAMGLGRGRAPWLDELPDTLELGSIAVPVGSRGVPVGLVDDPGAQAQYPALIDFDSGALLVVGAAGSGKTTALRTLAVSASLHHPPGSDPLSIVVLDFASRQLAGLAALGPWALIATGDDLEVVTRAIALLDRLLQHRRSALARAALDGSGTPRFDRVLLLVDDYGNLARAFEGSGAASSLFAWLETLNRVIVDGRQVGIDTALTAPRRAEVKPGVLSAVGTRIVLRQPDVGGYAELGLPSSVAAHVELPPGRGFLDGPDLVQLATIPEGPLPSVPRTGYPPAPLPAPELMIGALPREVAPLDPDPVPWRVPLGPADLDPTPVVLDASTHNLTVVGDPRTGRSTVLIVVAGHLAAAGIEVWVVGPVSSGLSALAARDDGGPGVVARSVFGPPADVAVALAEMAAEMEAEPGVVGRRALIIDDVDLLEDPQLDPPAARLVALGLHYAAATTSLRSYSTNALVQDMKKTRAVLHLQPPGSREVQELTGVNPRLRPGLPMGPGRGVLVIDRAAVVVQVSRPRC